VPPQDPAQLPFPESRQSESDAMADAPQRGALDGGTYFLGRYRVVDEIGIGGMASVHLARMDGPGGFQKWIAIKRIHPHLVEDPTFVNMFIDEARVAARISHPNVAAVLELGKHEDTYWIAMEYLHGEPLREVMRRTEELGQPMPPELACRVIADAAEGLHSAHELAGKSGEKLNLVHRDVTPHNLFVTYDGCTKVVDFGIAKFASRIASTRAGTLKGKVAYMSPEQVAGEPLDRRTDVFALGVVLWELTTGQRLFRMESDLDTMAKVQECAVPQPSSIVRGYPIDLEKIVMKALAKTKTERYRTARELSRALQSLLMRRSLFVAADEVTAYMQSIFDDRIRKREAHLRWAAEVTQTIDVDKLSAPAPSWRNEDGSVLTFNSEVQPSQSNAARYPPRPAAGVRVPIPAPLPIAPPPPAAPRRPLTPGAVEDASASEDPTTRARTGRAPVPRVPVLTPSFEDDLDYVGDTIVTESPPEIEHLRYPEPRRDLASPVPAAGLPAPPRLPAPTPPLPPVVVPPAPVVMQRSSDSSGMSVAAAHVDYPPAAGDGVPSEYDLRIGPLRTETASHGPADMQRLFAPPMRLEQRTVTRRSFRRRIPPWTVPAGAAVLGLMSTGVLALFLRHSPRPPGAGPASSAVVLLSSSAPGPLGAARSAFASATSAGAPLASVPPAAPPASVASSAAVATATFPSVEPSHATEEPPASPTRAAPPPRALGTTPQSTARGGGGTLKIICVPGCDQVIDNGNSLGPSPIVRRSASVGSHRIKLVWGDATKIVSTVVIAEQTATIRENHP